MPPPLSGDVVWSSVSLQLWPGLFLELIFQMLHCFAGRCICPVPPALVAKRPMGKSPEADEEGNKESIWKVGLRRNPKGRDQVIVQAGGRVRDWMKGWVSRLTLTTMTANSIAFSRRSQYFWVLAFYFSFSFVAPPPPSESPWASRAPRGTPRTSDHQPCPSCPPCLAGWFSL